MKTKDLVVICVYTEDGVNISQTVKNSFIRFLRNNLENLSSPCYVVHNHSVGK